MNPDRRRDVIPAIRKHNLKPEERCLSDRKLPRVLRIKLHATSSLACCRSPHVPENLRVIVDDAQLRAGEAEEFEPLVAERAIQIAQPDICHTGGLLETKKIASMCEMAGIGMAPHNPLGPIAGAAALHFAVSTPNFTIQEEMSGAVPCYSEVVRGPIKLVDGYWSIPQAPGLGVEVDEAIANAHPYKQEPFITQSALMDDGTVVDW